MPLRRTHTSVVDKEKLCRTLPDSPAPEIPLDSGKRGRQLSTLMGNICADHQMRSTVNAK
jgi:hypothetical protein